MPGLVPAMTDRVSLQERSAAAGHFRHRQMICRGWLIWRLPGARGRLKPITYYNNSIIRRPDGFRLDI
jgi:hypothetical protein